MMKNEHPDVGTLAACADGVLSDEESERVLAHVTECAECAEKMREHRSAVELFRAVSDTGTPEGGSPAATGGAAMLGSHVDGETLAAYADGSLDAASSRDVERHLALCDACTREVADLWRMQSEERVDPGEAAVAAAVERLKGEGPLAVVRVAGRAIELVSDFARGVSDAVAGLSVPREPAFAAARTGEPCADLFWQGGSGVVLEGRIDSGGGTPALRGRLTVGGLPAVGLSVALLATGVRRGPESTDAEGYFGPWTLAEGRNTIVLTGSALGQDTSGVRLALVLEH